MIVLADSSPLITLARAGHFELLREFYGEVIVSSEVHHEVTVAGAGLPGAEELQSPCGDHGSEEQDYVWLAPG